MCKNLLAALIKCGVTQKTACDILGSGCAERARDFGVDPTILCGAMMNEHGGFDGTGTSENTENWLAGSRSEWIIDKICEKEHTTPDRWGTGCISMEPKHARECLQKLKKCNPSLYNKHFGADLPSRYPYDWLRRIAKDCAWSLKVAAACMHVHTKCGTMKPLDWPRTWNPGNFNNNPKWPVTPGKNWYSKRAACIIRAFHENNPF